MADDPIAVWREAIKDPDHPRYRAAWLLFSENAKPEFLARELAERKDEVIPWLYEILDTDRLYEEESLGKGYAPINAVSLLGEWQVTEAVPRLLDILEENDWEAIVHDRAILALEAMGPPILEEILAFGEQALDEDQRITAAGILMEVGKGDARAYEFVEPLFDRQQDEWDVRWIAEILLNIDPDRAIPFLEGRMQNRRKYDKPLREIIAGYIEQTRKTGKP